MPAARIPKSMKNEKGLHLYVDKSRQTLHTSKYIHDHIETHKYCMICIPQHHICTDNCPCALLPVCQLKFCSLLHFLKYMPNPTCLLQGS